MVEPAYVPRLDGHRARTGVTHHAAHLPKRPHHPRRPRRDRPLGRDVPARDPPGVANPNARPRRHAKALIRALVPAPRIAGWPPTTNPVPLRLPKPYEGLTNPHGAKVRGAVVGLPEQRAMRKLQSRRATFHGGMAALTWLTSLRSAEEAAAHRRTVAVVYRGPGACPECTEAAGEIARRAGLDVRFASAQDITPRLLASCLVYVQGGGDDALDIRKALTNAQFESLRRYVADGGGYWGICAGAYLAGRWIDDDDLIAGLRLFDGDAEPYSGRTPKLEKVFWAGAWRWLYLQDAPKFVLDRGSQAYVLARYGTGDVAAFIAQHGRGWVAVSGPHPEATEEWLRDENVENAGLAPPDVAVSMLRDLRRRIGR